MRTLRRLAGIAAGLTLSVAASAPAAAQAATLSIGDDAPALNIAQWVKGDRIAQLDKGKAYVIEFWATW